MKPYKYFLPVLTVFFTVINLWVIFDSGEMLSRLVRFASMFLFLLVFISPLYFYKRGLPVFILLLISDGLLINYEHTIFNAFIFLVRTFIFLALYALVFRKLRQLKTNFFQKIVFVVALVLNIFLLYSLVETAPIGEAYSLYDVLFYIYGVSVIICVCGAVSFSNRYANRSSIFFLGAVLGLALSDLTFFIAYNIGFLEFTYVDVIFNMLGVAFLLKFMELERMQEGELQDRMDVH